MWFMVAIGVIFGFLAALSAYIITLDEYLHHYSDIRKPQQMARHAAWVTFLVFGGLSLCLVLLFSWFNI